MAYRGEDLDLRTPQGWGAAGREGPGADQPNWLTRTTVYKGGRADPIWVDDNVMACCNNAYELALAHRALEVRLEHMLNALTLNEAAAAVMEARGIGVISLRRESGGIIASEIATTATNGQASPRRSEALEETLRLAADRAYPRRTPVTVDDLLSVLFDMKRDLPGLQLLHRHATGWAGRNGADLRLEPLPHLARGYEADPRYAPPLEPRPRYGSAAGRDYFRDAAYAPQQPREAVREPLRDMLREPPRELAREVPRETMRDPLRETFRDAPRPGLRDRDLPPASVDGIQNNRIDSLERAVRDLGVDMADERKSLQQLVADLQRNAAVQADDTLRFRGGLSDRLASLEDTLHRSSRESGTVPGAVADRLGAIERSLDARLADMGRAPPVPVALIDHISAIERNIEDRLAELGRTSGVPTALIDRIAGLERSLDGRLGDLARTWSGISERLQALEQTARRPVETTLPPLLAQRLESVTGVGHKLEALEQTFQLILDRLTGLERKMAAPVETKAVDFGPLEARLESRMGDVERTVVTKLQQSMDMSPVTDLLSGIEGRVAGLERSIDNRTAETGRTVSFIGERLRAFEEQIGGQRTQIGERIGQIEKSLGAYVERTLETSVTHERDIAELHEVLLKLNANQQTLAGSLDQWRLDNTGDLSVVSNRLKAMEEIDQRRNPMIDQLAAQVDALHATLNKREVNKSRFREWLLGTDEWYSASYDTARWRARQAADTVREIDTRPRPMPVRQATPPAPPATPMRR